MPMGNVEDLVFLANELGWVQNGEPPNNLLRPPFGHVL